MNEVEFNRINSEKMGSILCGSGTLIYSKSPEEIRDDEYKASLAASYLEGLGIKVKTEYGFYRHSYDILKDLGEYLSKNNK